MEESKYRIKTLWEALKILQGMSESADPINQTEAAQISGASANTAYRMLETFAEMGFVDKVEGGYVVGAGLAKIWKVYRTDLKRRIETLKKSQKETYIEGEEEPAFAQMSYGAAREGTNGNGSGGEIKE